MIQKAKGIMPPTVIKEVRMDKSDEFYQEVAKVAYEIYEKRGSHGQDFDDWLEAERIVMARLSGQKSGKKKVPASSGKKRAGKQP